MIAISDGRVVVITVSDGRAIVVVIAITDGRAIVVVIAITDGRAIVVTITDRRAGIVSGLQSIIRDVSVIRAVAVVLI